MSTVLEYEAALAGDPTLMEPFVALRKAYRETEAWDKLITLYETRAQALGEGDKASELFYLAAEIRLDRLEDEVGAEADLAHAIDRNPDNLKATHRLKLLYRKQARSEDYVSILEMEAAALGKSQDAAQIAELDTELGQFCRETFTRLERAANLPASQRQSEVTPEGLKLIESARKIYRAVGDYRKVVWLYELELGLTSEAKRRGDLLLALGRVLGERLGDLEAAAQRLGEVVRLRPRDDRALEALAAVYANPRWLGADGKGRAAATYYQIARRRKEAGDVENALSALRKALAAVPGQPEASELLEQVLYGAGRLSDLDLYYRERVAEARSLEEKMDFLFKRAQLAEGDRKDPAEALRIYQEIVTIEPPGGPASQRLAELYTAKHDYGRLAELRELQLPQIQDAAFRLAVLTELATLYRDRLGDPEQAAVYWHSILQADPTHAEAFAAYAAHFRHHGDWTALVDLLEFSFEHARGAGHPVEELLERLEEIAIIAERNLGDTERALSAWQRMDELSPGHDRAREAQKRILQKSQQWERMAAVLEREAETATEPAQKIESLRRLARVLVEKLGVTDRAIDAYAQIQALDPADPVAGRALGELYERQERWGELARLLRAQLDASTSKQEKLSALRRLLGVYHDRLGDSADGSWAAAEILKLQPGDREALSRLEAILERIDDKARLVETLEYHARYASTSEEKLNICSRIADLLQNQVGDTEKAIRWWEEVLRLAPGNATALDALAQAYQGLGRAPDLAKVLEAQIAQPGQDPSVQVESQRQLARLYGGTLADPIRARKAWEEVLRATPSDLEALGALSDLYAKKGEWRALVGVLERRIPLASEPAEAVALALERARILEQELRIRGEAMAALDQLVEEIDPRCLPAYERLRRLAEAGGEWAKVVAVAEKQLFLEEDPNEKSLRALEIGELWRDRLGDPKNAIAAFERAVEIDPYSYVGLSSLAALYAETKEWPRLLATNEKLLELAANDPDERRRLMLEMARIATVEIEDARLGFDWYRRVYQEVGDEATLAQVEQVAGQHGLWDELIGVYEGARTKATDPAGQVALSSKIAQVVERSLGDPPRAFAVLRAALTSEPKGTSLLPEIERLAAASHEWTALLDVYAQVARSRPEQADRVALLQRRALVREIRLGDPSGALDENLRAFVLSPDDAGLRAEITRLAEATGRWEDALKVEAQRFARASDEAEKVEIACRAAALVEEKLRDHRRAFRAYLNAFRLSPENETLVAQLWRLAAVIEAEAEAAPTEATVELSGEILEEVEELIETTSGTELPAVSDEQTAPGDEPESAEGDDDDEAVPAATSAENEAPEPPPTPKTPPPTPGPLRVSPVAHSAWEEFARAYEILPAADKGARHRNLRHIAEIWERGAKDVDRALGTLERAFGLEPLEENVRADLRRIAEREGRWEEVCAIFGRAADSASRDEAVALQHDIARFREDLGQRELAEAAYRAILLLEPEDQAALDRLEELYRSEDRHAELAGILEKRATASSESLVGGTSRRQRIFELAELHDKRLDRPYEAIDTYERYLGSAEEDERRADHPDVLAANVAALEALARLYAQVGMWAKAGQALEREIELLADKDQLRSLRLRLAQILEKELGQIDPAITAYEAVLRDFPADGEALAALDRLLDLQNRHEDLQEILRRRIDLAAGAERTALIRRRARLLEERLGNPDAAAACLRSLGPVALEEDETFTALLRNLSRAGLTHEALRLIVQRIDLLEGRGADPRTLAALHLEAAALKADRLEDVAGARALVEKALALAPEDPAALSVLGRLYLGQNDFASYARVREREAHAMGASPEAAMAWLDAGRVYRDQLLSSAEARRCFEAACEADPGNVEALRALAAMLSAEGQNARARELFQQQLDLVDEPRARAAVLTDMARTLWEKPGDAPPAIVLLDEALDLAPDYLPAVVTMADIYYREQQWSEAERRLSQVIRRLRGQPAETAQLYHRLGEVYEKLGRLDDGYRQLQEADRMMPGQLLIRLAMGENRFLAKKWREAITHLEAVAAHPDAHRYPQECAEGLAHAAAAELRLKRPERAIGLFQAALTLSPGHRGALQALADLALERSEPEEAARHLRRLAEGSGDRQERARLFEKLGDVLATTGDGSGARAAYESAVSFLDQPGEGDLPVLEKLFSAQRQAGATEAAARTGLGLVALSREPRQRAARRREVAVLLEELGDHGQAGALLEKALAESPNDEAVLHSVVEAYERGKRRADLEVVLATTLPELPPVSRPKECAQRAALWEKLGDLRRRRNKAGAIEALEQAVALEPDRVSARVLLAKLYGDKAEHIDAALANHQSLVLADLTRDDSLRTLANVYAARGRIDWARCCLEVLDVLGLADTEDQAFLAKHRPAARKPEDPYAASLSEEDRARYLTHADARGMSEVFAAIWEGIQPEGAATVESLGLTSLDKVSPVSDLVIGQVYGQVAKALGNRRTGLYVRAQSDAVELLLPPPPTVVVGDRLLERDPTTLRFILGRAIELSRPELVLGAAMPVKAFTTLLASVLKAFHPRHARWRPSEANEAATREAARLKKALPYKIAKRLAELFAANEAQPFNSTHWRKVVEETGNRAGLLMCGDLKVAVSLVVKAGADEGQEPTAEQLVELCRRPGPVRELLRYAVSEQYFTLREALGTSVQKAAAA